MRRRSLAAVFASLSLIAAACTPDGGTATTTGDETGTSSPEEASTTAVEATDIENCEAALVDSDFESFGEGETHFAYLPDFLVVPASQQEEADSALEDIDHEMADVEAVLGEAETEDLSLVAARECLNDVLVIYRIIDGDALAIANDLRSDVLAIAPIHAFGEAGHAGYKEGTDPTEIENVGLEAPNDAREGPFAAVVDSGIYPDTPGLKDNVEYTPGLDEEPGGHSHGTFVSSIIRQLAPDHRITFARAPMRPVAEFAWSDADPGDLTFDTLTTELDVAEAILRLVHRHQAEPDQVKSLNLSLGAHSAVPEADAWVVATVAALNIWLETFPVDTTPVFAAGGNHDVADPLWPGALGSVTAVGALSDPEDIPFEIVWDENQREIKPTSTRNWIDELAPGSMLVNFTQPEVLAHWSGSSFASAVANGLYLRGEASLLSNPLRRSDVTDLTYWDGTQILP